MSIKIQKPTPGRVIHFATQHGIHVGIVIQQGGVRFDLDRGVIAFRNQNTNEVHEGVVHSADGLPGTWRYPPFVKDEIEVER